GMLEGFPANVINFSGSFNDVDFPNPDGYLGVVSTLGELDFNQVNGPTSIFTASFHPAQQDVR
ncbi:MAG: hypothetical protein KC561_12140, partial [Myxococcales bacterium]|nr:hypothetical protein [Myxococcales bacterium]